ncbi:MAG TPA: hypothetical protein VF586_13550 [Pyrinomonadaceae bacterium]
MPKNLLFAAGLLAASLAFGAAAKPADYSGAWSLDMKQSKNLPPFYANVQSHKLNITRDDRHLRVAVEIGDGGAEPFKAGFDYSLDGAETKTETQMRTPDGTRSIPTTLKAEVVEGGGLHITITRERPAPDGGSMRLTTVEDWRLGADGKTLNIRRADETPRGKTESDLVFVKG